MVGIPGARPGRRRGPRPGPRGVPGDSRGPRMARGGGPIDRDLAFGLVAAIRGLVDPGALVEALAGRQSDPSRSLRDLLVDSGALAADSADEVEEGLDSALAGLLAPGRGPGGRFRVLRPHARGGLGEVFVAQD